MVHSRGKPHAVGETGILGMVVAERLAGAGAGRATFASVISKIGRACASTALVVVSHIIAEKAVELTATDFTKNMWLGRLMDGQALGAFAVHEADSGSNAGAINTTARKDADHYIVERLFRDARGLTLHFKTSELLRQDVSKATLGL